MPPPPRPARTTSPAPWRWKKGRLDTPAAAAAKVLRFLARPDFGSQPVADVRDG